MSGFLISSPVGNLVVSESNAKAAKRFKRLMLRRIKWKEEEDDDEEEEDDDEDDAGRRANPDCQLVWEGVLTQRLFSTWKVVNARSEAEIRKALGEKKAEHYWDMIKRYRPADADLGC